MKQKDIIALTMNFVKHTLKGAEGGHDWFHVHRVFLNAKHIGATESVDELVVALAALLHDIADAKFHDGDEHIGPQKAEAFLKTLPLHNSTIAHVKHIIENISFKNSLEAPNTDRFSSKELEVVQDADRLDAIGAIGIARAFNYGGFKNRELHNPDILPMKEMTKEQYKTSNAPTINHFYEKLLLLKDKMNTESGKRIAEGRHRYMQAFLEQFFGEWNGER